MSCRNNRKEGRGLFYFIVHEMWPIMAWKTWWLTCLGQQPWELVALSITETGRKLRPQAHSRSRHHPWVLPSERPVWDTQVLYAKGSLNFHTTPRAGDSDERGCQTLHIQTLTLLRNLRWEGTMIAFRQPFSFQKLNLGNIAIWWIVFI